MKKYTDQMFCQLPNLITMLEVESRRQRVIWGIQSHSLFEWLTYTAEELGELAQAISKLEYDKDKMGKAEEVIKEAISVATLSLKIAEMVDNNNKKQEPKRPPIRILDY